MHCFSFFFIALVHKYRHMQDENSWFDDGRDGKWKMENTTYT